MLQFEWEILEGEASDTAVRLLEVVLQLPKDAIRPRDGQPGQYAQFEVRQAHLPFFESGLLLRYALHDGSANLNVANVRVGAVALDCGAETLTVANRAGTLKLTEHNVAAYLYFHCYFLRGSTFPLLVVDEALTESLDDESVQALVKPISVVRDPKEDAYTVSCSVISLGQLFAASFRVQGNGDVQMLAAELLTEEGQILALPPMPVQSAAPTFRAKLFPGKSHEASEQGSDEQEQEEASGTPLAILTELLLSRALRSSGTHRLVKNFLGEGNADQPIEAFAALVTQGFPVIAIETTIPFVEEVIADLVSEQLADASTLRRHRGVPSDDDALVSFQADFEKAKPSLVLVPLYVCRAVANVERLAFQLATKDIAALIACASVRDLPDALRKLVDFKLTLGELDAPIFAAMFTRVLGATPPTGWDAHPSGWIRHVSHTDFEHPRRLKLSADDALLYIQEQVNTRLRAVDVSDYLSLSELHGLGEARQFAEDLITDIHAAVRGDIPWAQVDRGALLAGPPGTGKTTLARAIAKECGIHFVDASVTRWQAAGEHLGHHIRAIRSTFEEARRYAPSILFIDEIDGLGNRERLGNWSGAQYQTEVINTVLEQIQGMDSEHPVFVIAATNYVDRVDPALRRAGRLDRVIPISLPNREALQGIYAHYLKEALVRGQVDATVDLKAVAHLSLGLTGADVERIVRGAVRRARKQARALSQADLLAEVTNKPRSDNGSLRLQPDELQRVAVHEAGHALALYFSPGGAERIGFITILPRPDGTLGFVAQLPDERMNPTRRSYVSQLEVVLAGRAAEHVVYGEEDISGGASSDLQVATSIASSMVTRLGLAGDGRLRVTEEPTERHLEAVDGILEGTYRTVMTKLREHRVHLDLLVGELMKRQELTGVELLRLFQ